MQSSSGKAPHFRACCFPHGLLIFWVLRKPAAPPAPAVQALGGAAVGGHMRQQTALSRKVFCLVSWGFFLGGNPSSPPPLHGQRGDTLPRQSVSKAAAGATPLDTGSASHPAGPGSPHTPPARPSPRQRRRLRAPAGAAHGGQTRRPLGPAPPAPPPPQPRTASPTAETPPSAAAASV